MTYKDLLKKYICLIYPVFAIIYSMFLFFSGIRTGIVMTFFLVLGAVAICALGFPAAGYTEDRVFTLYLVYNVLSGIWCVAFGIPVSVYLGELSTTVLPMILYYAGRGFDEEYAAGYYHYFILSALFLGALGAVMYIWAPRFYIDFSFDNSLISLADVPTMRVRMNSVIGSTAMASISAYSMCASVYFLRRPASETEKNIAGNSFVSILLKNERLIGLIYMVLSIVFAFMANQRSAMFCIILMLVFFNLIDFLVDKKRSLKYLWMEIAAVVILLLGIFVFVRGIIDKFWARLVSIPAGFGERSESWIAAVNNMVNFWIGDGLGSHGHRAADYQEYIVADGGLVKLYAEMGLIGTSMIVFVLALVYIKSFKKQQIRGRDVSCQTMGSSKARLSERKLSLIVPELAIVTSAILMSIGSNVLEMEICAPIAYFALGRAVRRLNDDKAGEEYIGSFEDDTVTVDESLEGAPASKAFEPGKETGGQSVIGQSAGGEA